MRCRIWRTWKSTFFCNFSSSWSRDTFTEVPREPPFGSETPEQFSSCYSGYFWLGQPCLNASVVEPTDISRALRLIQAAAGSIQLKDTTTLHYMRDAWLSGMRTLATVPCMCASAEEGRKTGPVVVEGKPVVEIVEPYSGILYPSNPVKPVAPVNPRYPSKEGIVVVVVVGKAAPETETSVAVTRQTYTSLQTSAASSSKERNATLHKQTRRSKGRR